MIFSFGYKPYLAIIGDIINSKALHNRNAVQKVLLNVLNNINDKYHEDIASRFTITLGDEFQGLMKSGASAVYIIDQIERALYPIKLRFGLGVGEITTDIQFEYTLGSDGPAYHNAREMIDALKTSGKKHKSLKKNTAIKVQDNEKPSALLNVIFMLLSVNKEIWTPRRVEIINAYLNSNGTQTDTAEALGIYQSNVQKALASSNYYTYQEALDTIASVLADINERAYQSI